MKWNYIAMGKKNNKTTVRVICFPTYLICPRRSHGDTLFPTDELHVIRNPFSSALTPSHIALHIQLAIPGENCETELKTGSKKKKKIISNMAPPTIIFCFYLMPIYILCIPLFFCYRTSTITRIEQLW
jgi:hypothetical protein